MSREGSIKSIPDFDLFFFFAVSDCGYISKR